MCSVTIGRQPKSSVSGSTIGASPVGPKWLRYALQIAVTVSVAAKRADPAGTDGSRMTEQRSDGRSRGCQDHVGRERNQFRRVARALGIAHSPTVVGPHVAAVTPSQFLQPLHERGEASLPD